MPASPAPAVTRTNGDLTATAHLGDRSCLLAFDIPQAKAKGLAGFAVRVTPQGQAPYWLKNRLSFAQTLTKTNTLNGPKGTSKYADSVDAPFQMCHWVDFPPGGPGSCTYEVTARYFTAPGTTTLKDGPKVSLAVDITDADGDVSLGMTRGYVSSQAFIDRFATFDKNSQAVLWPKPQTIDFSTAPYEKVYEYLKQAAPGPFKTEVDAGPGQHIHHKFVVCDFNGSDPVVFCGSSNLAAGGETSNGDNLLEIRDPRVVSAYAVEAIRLFDHYRFRSRQSKATKVKPLGLGEDDSWSAPFYDPKQVRYRERQVFAQA